MITDSFDMHSKAIINPQTLNNLPEFDACIVTFSWHIEQFVLENYRCERVSSFKFVSGETPIYAIKHNGKKFAFFKTYVGAPACVGAIEDTLSKISTKKYIVFGGAGCLNKEISRGKIMVPTDVYRDEGTSYHYMPPSDYISINNANVVCEFMKSNHIPHVAGRGWTTDAFYRETVNNFEKRKADGCISVDMECSAIQAMCNFRDLDFFTFFSSGDLLDAPKWESRKYSETTQGSQHDPCLFEIALRLADYVTSTPYYLRSIDR